MNDKTIDISKALLEDILEDTIELYNIVYSACCVPGKQEKIKAEYEIRIKQIKKLLK